MSALHQLWQHVKRTYTVYMAKAARQTVERMQGFSADWWKGKHNTHHAAPNELEHDSKSPVDPDIDTLPLVAWSVEMLESLPNASHRALVRAQHYFFFPILLFARLSWCQQSVAHAYTMFQVSLTTAPAMAVPCVPCIHSQPILISQLAYTLIKSRRSCSTLCSVSTVWYSAALLSLCFSTTKQCFLASLACKAQPVKRADTCL